MTRRDHYVSVEHDRSWTPFTQPGRPAHYVTSEMWLERRVQAAIRLQCFFRSVKAKRLVRGMRARHHHQRDEEQRKERRRLDQIQWEKQHALESKLHPHTAKDFEALYHGLQQWLQAETARINVDYGEKVGWSKEGLRLAKLADLVDQETILIQKMDRLKLAAKADNHQHWIKNLLDRMSNAKQWKIEDGKTAITLDTPSILRARELRDLYLALARHEQCTVDERLQILLHVKHTVQEYDCRLTRDIVDLIDREGDLISRGRDRSTLEGLRQRIGNLFLQFVRTAEFNPEAARYTKIPSAALAANSKSWTKLQKHGVGAGVGAGVVAGGDTSNANNATAADGTTTTSSTNNQQQHVLGGGAAVSSDVVGSQMYACRSCNKYLPSTAFYLHTTMRHLGKCKSCTADDNMANRRDNELGLHQMMNWIRAEEIRKVHILRTLWERYYVSLGSLDGETTGVGVGSGVGSGVAAQDDSTTTSNTHQHNSNQNHHHTNRFHLIHHISSQFARALGGFGLSGDALESVLEHASGDGSTTNGTTGTGPREALLLAERITDRLSEEGGGHSTFLTFMTDHDLRYLLDTIWKKQSAMPVGQSGAGAGAGTQSAHSVSMASSTSTSTSESAQERLTFTRWDPFLPFSPWNCVLLTKQEAATHDRHSLAVAMQNLVAAAKSYSTRRHQYATATVADTTDTTATTATTAGTTTTTTMVLNTTTPSTIHGKWSVGSVPEHLYSPHFVATIRARHLLARQHFTHLLPMEKVYLEKLLQGGPSGQAGQGGQRPSQSGSVTQQAETALTEQQQQQQQQQQQYQEDLQLRDLHEQQQHEQQQQQQDVPAAETAMPVEAQ